MKTKEDFMELGLTEKEVELLLTPLRDIPKQFIPMVFGILEKADKAQDLLNIKYVEEHPRKPIWEFNMDEINTLIKVDGGNTKRARAH